MKAQFYVDERYCRSQAELRVCPRKTRECNYQMKPIRRAAKPVKLLPRRACATLHLSAKPMATSGVGLCLEMMPSAVDVPSGQHAQVFLDGGCQDWFWFLQRVPHQLTHVHTDAKATSASFDSYFNLQIYRYRRSIRRFTDRYSLTLWG